MDTFVISATGHTSVKSAIPKDADEWRKSLTSLLKKASNHIVFDNAVTRLDSAQLCRALTSELYGDRLLGTNQTGEYPQQGVWFLTSNNPELGGDLPRRCYPINIDLKMAQPWKRSGFRHDPLEPYVMGRRGEVIAAVLTLARLVCCGSTAGRRSDLRQFRIVAAYHRRYFNLLRRPRVPR